jgi:flagellar biosynthetic protein FliP
LPWLLSALPALAEPAEPLSLLGISAAKNASGVSVPMQIVILLTLMTLLPAAVMSITPFLRITVVLHFLRQALGTQSTPSNQVLLGLALFLTIVVMQPVAADMYHQGWNPWRTAN